MRLLSPPIEMNPFVDDDLVPARVHRLEVGVFLLLIVPSMVISFWAIRTGDVGFGLTAVATIFRDAGLVVLVMFLLWRNGEPRGAVGLTPRRMWTDMAIGVVVFPPFFYVTSLVERFFVQIGFSTPKEANPISLPARSGGDVVLAVVLVTVVAFSEELIFRGYLIRRFRGARMGTAVAVLMATLIFALGHGYEGGAGIATVGVMGLVFALVYLWRRSLVASMTMHFLQDLALVVVLPLIAAS